MSNGSSSRNPTPESFDAPTEQRSRYQLDRRLCYLAEVHDVHFHFDSAVMLPDTEVSIHAEEGGPVHTTALGVLAAVYGFAKQNPGKKTLICGHTDTKGPDAYNLGLSRLRADAVLSVLTGNLPASRDRWTEICRQKHKVEDIQQILKWASTERGWACDPGPITDSDNPETRAATEVFQRRYNEDFGRNIDVDGIVGSQTWGAIFDVYQAALARLLGTDNAGLQAAQNSLTFVNNNKKAVGCGEYFPIEAVDFDEYESATNRRVEVLFFPPGKEPSLDCHPQPDQCQPEQCQLYELNRYRFIPIPPQPVPVAANPRLTSPGIDNARKASHGAAVLLNDDHDNGSSYAAGAGGGHRELEPIFDLDYLQETPNEDDLLTVDLDLDPPGQPDDVELRIVEGAPATNRIRLWPRATKGANADVIALPARLPANSLPRQFFVEGLATGQVTLEASYTNAGQTRTDRLVINVVELRESQGGARKIIYDYNSDITFEVVGAPANYTFEWDLDGDGNFNTAVFEQGKTTARATCRYGAAADANTVQLDETAANTQKAYDVAVRMTGGFVAHVKGRTVLNGAITRGMRVALGSHQGGALPAQNNAGIQGAYAWNDAAPVAFDATTVAEQNSWQASHGITQPIAGAGRIQYGPAVGDYAVTPYSGIGNGRRVLGVAVGPVTWTGGETREDLDAYVNHEERHLRQHVAVRDNDPANNVWRRLDNHYGAGPPYSAFREAHAHLHELREPRAPWRHHTFMSGLRLFVERYNSADGLMAAIPAGATKNDAKQLLQELYRLMPFDEMRRPGYDFYVRAPQ
jgi:outer membrane protein OmpA-like peptidoglycan-associated protein